MDTKERYNELIEYHNEMSKQASLANTINDILTEFCILIDQNKITSNSEKAEAALSLVAACERIYAEHCVDTEDKFEYELNYTKEKAFEYYKKMNS
jgi:hypothetical protein